MLKKLIATTFFLITIIVTAQSIEKPFRVDIKAGFPAVIGFTAEYVTPFLGNRLAVYAGYHGVVVNYHHDDVDERVRYFDGGINIFFNQKGTGIYSSIGYGRMFLTAEYTDIIAEDGSVVIAGYSEFAVNTLNLKMGLKTNGRLYFRGEIGFGLGDVPKEVPIYGAINDVYESKMVERPYYPGMTDSGNLLATMGIGYSF